MPSSVLREKSSLPLRKLLVESNQWDSVWSFPEDHKLLFGGSQGVSVIGVTVGEETDVLTSFGPLQTDDLSSGKGLVSDAPFFELERGHGPHGRMHHGQFQRCPDRQLKGLGPCQQ